MTLKATVNKVKRVLSKSVTNSQGKVYQPKKKAHNRPIQVITKVCANGSLPQKFQKLIDWLVNWLGFPGQKHLQNIQF